MPKSTEELKDDLRQASGLEGFLVDNQKDFRQYTLAEYLNQLLEEKHLSKRWMSFGLPAWNESMLITYSPDAKRILHATKSFLSPSL